MDSEHRHELKQNDLEAFLTHFKDFWAKWGNAITIVVLVVVIAFTGYRLLSTRRAAAREKALGELASANSPASLMALARETGIEVVRARAYLRGGDLILQSLAMPKQDEAVAANPGETPGASTIGPSAWAAAPKDDAERDKRLAEAASMYRQVIDRSPHPLYTHNARLGLATIAEAQGKLDEAAKAYEQIAQEAAEAFPLIAAQATTRRAMLDRLAVPVTFAPEPAEPQESQEAQETPPTQEAPSVDAPAEPAPDEAVTP